MTTMFFEKHICAVDTEARENLRARDSKFYQMLSAAVVAPDGVKLHLPVKPMGVELEDIDSTFNNLPFPPEVLYHAPRPSEVRNMIKAMVRGCNVLVWNAEHEEQHLPFLAERDGSGQRILPVQDVMRRAAPYVKDWNSFFADYEYPSLMRAATALGLEVTPPGWHDARADAQMVLDLWEFMEANPPFSTRTDTLPLGRALPAPSNVINDLPF